MEIVVIGAGASGLTAAIEIAKKNKVTIVERYDNCAKKILVTGNGRCNYWNEDFDSRHFNSNNKDFILKVNTLENQRSVLDFFESIGIVPFIKNGYYYPMSMQASSIRNALLLEARKRGVKIINNANVIEIKKVNDKFLLMTTNGGILCDKVIVATGSNSYYKEENLGYTLCKSLGHNIIKVMPSLVQLVGNDNYFKDWAGVRSNVRVKISVDSNILKKEEGEVMLTDYGVSGICIFNLSSIANKALDLNKKVIVHINFFPQISNIYSFLEERNKILINRNLEEFFEGILNSKLIKIILYKTNLDKNKRWEELNEIEKKSLCDNLTNFKVNIISSKSFDSSQVCLGGIDTSEVNPETMESKLCKNLYIIGEVLDVDGDCGGYNLGFAWLSGIIAGRSVNND